MLKPLGTPQPEKRRPVAPLWVTWTIGSLLSLILAVSSFLGGIWSASSEFTVLQEATLNNTRSITELQKAIKLLTDIHASNLVLGARMGHVEQRLGDLAEQQNYHERNVHGR